MVKKQSNPLDDPPTASSSASEDDEVQTSEEGEEEEEVSSSEEEESSDPVKAPSAAVTIAVPGKSTAAAAVKQDESDSESGSETETDSDSETERPSNPASGKSAAVTTVVAAKQKEAQAQSSAALALPAAKSGTKRPSEGTSKDTKAKRAKKVTLGDDEKKTGEDTKKPAFQRLWSEEDEIAVLQGMIDFKSDTGKSFSEDTNGFYEFIKKSISFDVSKNQFMDKIRSLKKKYMGKEKNGVEPSFAKPHDQKSFELSKVIWGPEGIVVESTIKANGASNKSRSRSTKKKLDELKQELFTSSSPNGKKVEEDNTKKVVVHGGGDVEPVKESDWFENSFIARSISGFGLDEHSVKQRWSLVPKESKKKIEEKLKALQAKEIEFVLQKTEFLHQVTSLIAEASKNKSN